MTVSRPNNDLCWLGTISSQMTWRERRKTTASRENAHISI